MNKKTVFVRNRLDSIGRNCDIHPIKFNFIQGNMNAADCITRAVSYKLLAKTSFWYGPSETVVDEEFSILVPNKDLNTKALNSCSLECTFEFIGFSNTSYFKSFRRNCKVLYYVLKFCSILTNRYSKKFPRSKNLSTDYGELMDRAKFQLIRMHQNEKFPDIMDYFNSNEKILKNIPNSVKQLNIFRDSVGILRVKSKIRHIGKTMHDYPILLAKNCDFTESIIWDIHHDLNHSGKYSVLSQLRKEFYLPSCFSTVRKILRSCQICKRFNNRSVKLNQNCYRDFRANPENVPFRNIFIDYFGPLNIYIQKIPTKIYVLIFSCLFSRAINLEICLDLSVKNFLRSFQLQVYKHGLPSLCLSDAGSQILPGSKIISELLEDAETLEYMKSKGVKNLTFNNFNKGCKKLGGLVETCIKMVKRLIFGSIGNNAVNYSNFELLLAECKNIVNKRPICLKETLRDNSLNDPIPSVLTPELIIYGYELVTVSVLPNTSKDDWVPPNSPKLIYDNLTEIRQNLHKIYEEEFFQTLMYQATNESDRYKPVTHHKLSIGDVVLVKENFMKRCNFPLARVTEITTNSANEVTDVTLIKGNKETIKRHVSSVIPYLKSNLSNSNQKSPVQKAEQRERPKRAAAERSRDLFRNLAKLSHI